MTISPLLIYVDRLKDGSVDKFSESISTDFLGVCEKELSFNNQLSLSREIYVADDHLIIRLSAKTSAYVPCAICNMPVELTLIIDNFYHAQPLVEISSGIFDLTEMLREDLLIQVPQFSECSSGKCPARKEMKQFLKEESSSADSSHSFQYPFANLKTE